MSSRRAILCSRNAHKARELERLLPGWEIEPLDRDDYPPETGETYADNARIKAAFGRAHANGSWVLAEDSGLEVEALGGRPGVHSARYAADAGNVGGQAAGARQEDPFSYGDGGGSPAVAKLLGELDGVDGRGARYVSELVLLADGEELRGAGILAGTIAGEARGSEGFGYDPVFVPDGEQRTVAELGDAWKSRNSHRARAAHALLERLDGAAR